MAKKKTWKYIVEVVLTLNQPVTKSKVKRALEKNLSTICADKIRVRSVDLE